MVVGEPTGESNGPPEDDFIYLQLQAPCVMATQDKTPADYVGYAKGLVVPKYLLNYLVKEGEFDNRTL